MNPVKYLMENRGFSLFEIDNFLGKAREGLNNRPKEEQEIFIEVMDNLLHQRSKKNTGAVIGSEIFPPRKTVSVKEAAELSKYFSGDDLAKVIRIKGAKKIVLAPRGKEVLTAMIAVM